MVRPAKIHIVVGPPMVVEAPADGKRPSRRLVQELTLRLHTELQRLLDRALADAG
jgi:hypothetical protein